MKRQGWGAWAKVGLVSLTLVSCAEQINMLKARQAFKDANIAYAAKDYARAIDDYQKAIDLDANDKAGVRLHSTFYLGSSHHLLYRPGRTEEDNQAHLDKAIDLYLKTLEIDANYRFAIEQLAGIYRDHLDDFESAEKYFLRIIEMEPDKPENYYSLGALYEKFYDPDEHPTLMDKAIEAYKKPIELNPNDPAVYRQVAALLNKYGRFDETMEWMAKARDVQPDNPEGYYTMATYYWDKVFRDPDLNAKQRQDYIVLGMEQVDRSLELKADYVEGIIYKGLLLREEAKLERNARRKQALMDEAKALQEKALALKKEQDAAKAAAAAEEAAAARAARD